MALSLSQNATIAADKLHVYIRPASTVLANYETTDVSAALADAIHLKNVETGVTAEEAVGNTIVNTIGQTLTLDVNMTGSMNVLGLTGQDMTDLKEGTDKIQSADIDVFFVAAPLSRASGSALPGDRIYCIYNVKATVTIVVADGQPAKLAISFDTVTSATESAIKVGDVVADIP